MSKRTFTIIASVIGLLIVGLIGFVGYEIISNSAANVIVVWTIDGNQDALAKIATVYHQKYPQYSVKIVPVPQQVYEFKSLYALATEKGSASMPAPDVWVMPNEWFDEHRDKLVAAPDGALDAGVQGYTAALPKGATPRPKVASGRTNVQIIQQDYAPIASNDLISNNQVWGVPLNIDTLALFYDKSKIASAPKTWTDVINDVRQFTQKTGSSVTRSVIALGDASSVSDGQDILSTLMLQNGVTMVNDTTNSASFNARNNGTQSSGINALDFYTSFMRAGQNTYTWQSNLGNSLTTLKSGKTMMAIGYLSDYQGITASGGANIAVAPLPQVDLAKPETYGRYLAAGVTKQAAVNPKNDLTAASWKFVALLANPDLTQQYASDTQTIPARKDVAARFSLNTKYAAFADQAGQAVDWQKKDVSIANNALDESLSLVVNSGQSPQVALDVAAKNYTDFLQSDPGYHSDPAILDLWQSSDDTTNYKIYISDFVSQNKSIKRVAISKHNPMRFEWDILNAMAAHQGPDILLMPNNLVSRYLPALKTFPANYFNPSTTISDTLYAQRTFSPVVANDGIFNNKVYAMPASVETLMLAYNVDAFTQVQNDLIKLTNKISAKSIPGYNLFWTGPTTWDDLKTMASDASLRNGSTITRSLVALGTGSNVEHASDIFAALTMQYGADFSTAVNPVTDIELPLSSSNDTVPGQKALDYIRSFANTQNSNYSWNSAMPDSLNALATGQAVAAFIYPRDIAKIQAINSQIRLAYWSLPQLSVNNQPVDFASYYTMVIPSTAKNPKMSGAFIKIALADSKGNNQPAAGVTPYLSQSPAVSDRIANGHPQLFQKNDAQSFYGGEYPNEVKAIIVNLLNGSINLSSAASQINAQLQTKILS